MGLKEKVTVALRHALHPEQITLQDDDGISGFIVSSRFERMPSLERQTMISQALRRPGAKLSRAELRRILAIAALTPVEYEALGVDANGAGGASTDSALA